MIQGADRLSTYPHIHLADLRAIQLILQLQDESFDVGGRIFHVVHIASPYARTGVLYFVGNNRERACRVLGSHHTYHVGGS